MNLRYVGSPEFCVVLLGFKFTNMILNFTLRSSGFLRHSSLKQSKPLLRTFKLFPIRKPLLLDKSQFRVIYDFPYAKLVGAVLKSKTSVTTAGVISSGVLFFFEEIRSAAYVTILAGGLYYLSCVLASKLGNQVVGKVYVNKEGDIKKVIISSLDADGRRIDRLHRVEDILNIDFPNKMYQTLGFSKIAVENSDVQYKINVVSCKYIDQAAFDFLFGLRPNIFIDITTDSNNASLKNNSDVNAKEHLPKN